MSVKLAKRSLKLGTRGSPLALWQAECVAQALRERVDDLEVVIVTVRSAAEKFPDRPLAEIGVGVFTRELDEALLDGSIDIAVHSSKDLPSRLDAGLVLAAVLEREDPRDALISSGGLALCELPRGARIGTGSPRRKSQLLAYRPDFEVVPLRGNVGTRLKKMAQLSLDATVLACAGLKRLGEDARIGAALDPRVMVPAAGQGAIGVVAAADSEASAVVAGLDDVSARIELTAERSFMAAMNAGCQAPVGAHATLAASELTPSLPRLSLRAAVLNEDGSRRVLAYRTARPDQAAELGARVAEEMLREGGAELLARPV